MDRTVNIAVFPVFSSGTRLLPLTYGLPKELLPLGRRTLLHHAMKEALIGGINEFIFLATRSINLRPYLLDSLHKETLKSLGLNARKYPEQYENIEAETKEWFSLLERVSAFVPPRTDLPGGLASAIASVERVVAGRPFAFILPDDFIDTPEAGLRALIKIWSAVGGWAVSLTQISNSQFREFGVVDASPSGDGVWTINGAIEKPESRTEESGLGIVGRYIFDENVFRLIEQTKEKVGSEGSQSGFHVTEAIHRFATTDRVTGVLVKGSYFHVGTMQGYFQAWRNI